jgi:protein-S-isoprenylcysteine O-methyltransferase Ste14
VFEKQSLHLLALLILLGGVFAARRVDGFCTGSLWGVTTWTWFVALIILTVCHQVYVWFCWRIELYGGRLTTWFGNQAFHIYAVGFVILILLRPVLMTLLSISNRNTIPSHPIITTSLVVILALPALYLMYSVKKYFGFQRAFGIDHFDTSYRSRPLVRKGIFRFTNNGMYYYGFLVLWIPGVLFSSITALVAALFSHLYIWVHFFCTEKPDMRYIYGGERRKGEGRR